MDIGRAITFFAEDDHWVQKVGIGTGVILISMLLSPILVGFLGFFILGGYAIRLLQNVRDGQAQPLPEWNEWGGDLARGFKYAVVGLVWSLAGVLMMVPMTIGIALANSGDVGAFIGSAILICTSCLLLLYIIFIALAAPGFTISFAHDEHISSGLKVTKVWQWTQANLGQVIIAMLVILAVSFVVNMLAGLLGMILCLVGTIVTVPFSMLYLVMFQSNLYGQLAREHPMYDSPNAVPAPVLPPAPDGAEVVATTATDESNVIIPPAPADATSGDAVDQDASRSADAVAVDAVTVDEVVAAPVDDVVDDAVEVVAAEVSDAGDEISAGVDDIVDASADVAAADDESAPTPDA